MTQLPQVQPVPSFQLQLWKICLHYLVIVTWNIKKTKTNSWKDLIINNQSSSDLLIDFQKIPPPIVPKYYAMLYFHIKKTMDFDFKLNTSDFP